MTCAGWPPLAICLVTWNHWSDTAACLDSLRRSDYAGERQLWIVDNASDDETRAAIRRDYPDVHLIENAWNAGFAVAMNQALGAALAAWPVDSGLQLLILNNDTILDPACLSTLVDALCNSPQAGIAAPTIYYHADPERIWYAGGGLDPVACRAWHEHLRTTDQIAGPPRSTGYATGCALLIRDTVLRQVGLLDESYFMYWEDADLCARARSAGCDILHVPEARMWHKVSASTGGNLAPKKLWRKFSSGWKFWSRYHETASWPFAYLATSWRDLRRAKAAAP